MKTNDDITEELRPQLTRLAGRMVELLVKAEQENGVIATNTELFISGGFEGQPEEKWMITLARIVEN